MYVLRLFFVFFHFSSGLRKSLLTKIDNLESKDIFKTEKEQKDRWRSLLTKKKECPFFALIYQKSYTYFYKNAIFPWNFHCNQIYFPFTHKREKKNGFIPSFPTVYRQKNYTYCLFPHLSIYPLGRSLLC